MSAPVIPGPGVYLDIPMPAYHSWPLVSNSSLGALLRSPAHMRVYMAEGFDETPAKRLGRAIHAAVLEPDEFDSRWVRFPKDLDRRTKAGKDVYADLSEQGEVLTDEDWLLCERMRAVVHSHPVAGKLLEGRGEVELSCIWNEKWTGVPCKGRWDRWSPDVSGGAIVDYKTTRDASRHEFQRAIFNYGYARQGAMYLDGGGILERHAAHYVIIAQEKEPPYAVAVYRLRDDVIEKARLLYLSLLELYTHCKERNHWPAYSEEVNDIGIPTWAHDVMAEQTTRIQEALHGE